MSTGTGRQHLAVWPGRRGRPSGAPPVASTEHQRVGVPISSWRPEQVERPCDWVMSLRGFSRFSCTPDARPAARTRFFLPQVAY
jgi:hypothetical protein